MLGGSDSPVMDPEDFVFGFGRRECPGQELANANIFISMAMSLAVFDILPVKDSNGVITPTKAEFVSGTVRFGLFL
jgi:cytochrome P450